MASRLRVTKSETPPEVAQRIVPAPELPYRPCPPRQYNPPIGLIGCGGISRMHLRAYADAGFRVVGLCDIDAQRAESRRAEFFPDAVVYEDFGDLLRQDEIEVVDITTHPPIRPALIEHALMAGKHVLSQKPYVLDLDVGLHLADLADRRGLRLGVNQNARWAPHFSYAYEAIRCGLLGELSGVHLSVHWDHTWVRGTEFERVKHLILYDFAIHWFDIVSCFMQGQVARRVFASTARTLNQPVWPPLLGQALIEYDHAQASLAFDADTHFGHQDRTYITGSQGTLISVGPDNKEQHVLLHTAAGIAQPKLQGHWFPDGFQGTMAELLRSIEEDRQPTINARDNITSLALCFAAVVSAERNEPATPGSIRKLPV